MLLHLFAEIVVIQGFLDFMVFNFWDWVSFVLGMCVQIGCTKVLPT
jgi:hypothetical protein